MVSNRQMTQSVFRQLEEGWAWDDPLFGMEDVYLWGQVNYHFRGCCQIPPFWSAAEGPFDPESHINVVFSSKASLYRCTVHGNYHPREYAHARLLPQLFIAG